MTEKQFYDWQTLGGTDDVMRFASEACRDLVWSIARDGDGFLLKVATLENTLQDKIRIFSNPKRKQSKRLNNLAEIARLIEQHPDLLEKLPINVRSEIERFG